MSTMDRRSFLHRLAAYGSGTLFAPSLAGLVACNELPWGFLPPRVGKGDGGYGDLAESPDCPEVLIPAGFTCIKLSETLAPSQADPGFTVPQAFDGMAAFPLDNGSIRLIRNHEIRDPADIASPFGGNPYDPNAGGGTTSLEVRSHGNRVGRELELVAEYPTLAGTHVNCAGGPTPWKSWLTCEETTEGRAQGRLRSHGYIFEVPVDARSEVSPLPLKSMGRFVHEAVAVDPATGFAYETEDRSFDAAQGLVGSGFYRFLPARSQDLSGGGRLQVLKVEGEANYNTTIGQRTGVILPVEWVDIDDPDPAGAETDPSAVFRQGLAKGAAIFQRLEGCWYGDHSIFFNSTSGGDAGAGQVWQYRPLGSQLAQLLGSSGHLILVFESPSVETLDSPDNICASPRGGLVLCEDGGGVQFIRGLTRRGQIFDLVQTNGELPESCGSTFSPDGEILFFNIQGSTSSTGTAKGGTYAMWGPWAEGAL